MEDNLYLSENAQTVVFKLVRTGLSEQKYHVALPAM